MGQVSTVVVNKVNLDNTAMRIKLTHLAANEAAQVEVDGSCVSFGFMDVQSRSAGGALRQVFPPFLVPDRCLGL